MATPKEWQLWCEWLEAIEQNGVNLTTWEETFVESIREKFDRYQSNSFLSDSQQYQLERIYTERVP